MEISRMLDVKGFSLIEVILAAAISIVGATICFFFIQSVRTHKSQVDQTLSVKEVMADNVVEVKGAQNEDLPAPGECLIRTYTNKKVFISESTITASPCPSPTLTTTQMQIVWEVAPTTAIVANFSSPSLKLPNYAKMLKQITIHSWSYNDAQKLNLTHGQIVIFKK
ncbi:type II secretion system protein [Bdellovibrio sp. HCB337]|uniref:type II secretion system protein n=1 Tax=Bdellovibrio sp. HCB337 TaxID=3394358 RepID=UPI0039A47867